MFRLVQICFGLQKSLSISASIDKPGKEIYHHNKSINQFTSGILYFFRSRRKTILAINNFFLSMKRSPDNQMNASFIDISRIKWLVFYCGLLSSAQLDRWQAPKQWPIIDQCPVEQTAFQRDQRLCDNGYKSVFTNSWLVRQRHRSWIKGLGKIPQKEWTRSLLAVPFARGHLTVTPGTPRNDGVYTRQSPWWHRSAVPTKICGFIRHPMPTD